MDDDGHETESDTAVQPSAAPSQAELAFSVTVVAGLDRGTSIRVEGSRPSRLLVGQSPACDLRLSDPMVSRRHAAFDVVPSGLRFTDLGSTNGSTCGGLQLFDACLHGGEVLRLGDTLLQVQRVDEPSTGVALSDAAGFGRAVGASIVMRRLYGLCERIAQSRVPVVIEGETGTGKEVLAESLHEAGPRAQGPFVVFDCTTVAASLAESELFGHERGAFTGASSQRKGVFEQAHRGTLFIDEVGDLDVSLQPKLLRAIERSEIRRMGGDRWVPVDVRIITATRRDLDREVQAGRFRDDLFFRLAVARIELPPLRARRGDVTLLAEHFWKQLGGAGNVPFDLLRRYEEYPWPGNVRELHNAVARHLALGMPSLELASTGLERAVTGSPDAPEDFLDRVLALRESLPAARQRAIDELERRYVERIVVEHGSIVRAAAASGLGLRHFQKIRARTKG